MPVSWIRVKGKMRLNEFIDNLASLLLIICFIVFYATFKLRFDVMTYVKIYANHSHERRGIGVAWFVFCSIAVLWI